MEDENIKSLESVLFEQGVPFSALGMALELMSCPQNQEVHETKMLQIAKDYGLETARKVAIANNALFQLFQRGLPAERVTALLEKAKDPINELEAFMAELNYSDERRENLIRFVKTGTTDVLLPPNEDLPDSSSTVGLFIRIARGKFVVPFPFSQALQMTSIQRAEALLQLVKFGQTNPSTWTSDELKDTES